MKKIAISQSNYIPWKGYFDMINSVDVFVIYDEVQYTKNDWRNRNLLKTKNGVEWITIPVKHTKLNQTIDETLVATTNWNVKHWKMIQATYGKAPYFNKYKEELEALYININTNSLSEINFTFMKKICELLGITTKLINSRSLNLQGDRVERLIDACIKLNANIYVSGPTAKGYLDEKLFSLNNLSIEWMDYSGYKSYKQMTLPFEHAVSVLDLLFNEGDNASKYLKTFN